MPRAVRRNNVTTLGPSAGQPVVFAHGFGCDQRMLSSVIGSFVGDFRVVLFDDVAAGGSDPAAFGFL